jgi:hypothetical protein
MVEFKTDYRHPGRYQLRVEAGVGVGTVVF